MKFYLFFKIIDLIGLKMKFLFNYINIYSLFLILSIIPIRFKASLYEHILY